MYCPECRSEYRAGVVECADCKIPLIEELPPPPQVDFDRNWVEVYQNIQQGQLAVARSMLESEGIPVVQHPQSFAMVGAALAGRLLVPAEHATSAQAALEELNNPSESAWVQPIPEGFQTVTPYLLVEGAAELLTFMQRAFGASEKERTNAPDGTVMHAQLHVEESMIMVAEAARGFAPMPAALHLYVVDVDATYQQALEAGATSVMEPADQFYGDRSAGVKDPSGNVWFIATHIEDVSPEEIARRAADR